ncbi:hypothetical protein [Flammeovirga sp. OC4]|uniref:hypothetical protein n=1 Tax=Flammeovirga sp. OC4 TaxID=1382345 RepID=UPI0005C4D76C|nr:hypothetical protein [Flammeovirga sp. OC4]
MATRNNIIQFVIDEFQKTINEFHKESEESIQNTIDSSDTKLYESNTEDEISSITIANSSIDALSDTVQALKKSLKQEHTEDKVRGGSVIETPVMYLIMGTHFPPVKFEGKQVTGVASDAPIYKSIIGKKQGEEIKLGNQNIKINLLK